METEINNYSFTHRKFSGRKNNFDFYKKYFRGKFSSEIKYVLKYGDDADRMYVLGLSLYKVHPKLLEHFHAKKFWINHSHIRCFYETGYIHSWRVEKNYQVWVKTWKPSLN